jgi:hypothetical protein
MVTRIRRALLATALVAGAAAAIHGCAILGTIDFNVTFRPTGAPRSVTCDIAAVTNVRFRFLDQALGDLLRTEVVRPCVPTERYRVTIDLGPYNIQVQGLNPQLTICYETNLLYRVEGGKTETLTIEAGQHPNGATAGCTYPTVQ